MASRFTVRIGRCNQCPPGSDTTHVACYENGLSLCEKHDNVVRDNHRAAYKNHPLRRDSDGD